MLNFLETLLAFIIAFLALFGSYSIIELYPNLYSSDYLLLIITFGLILSIVKTANGKNSTKK